MHLRVFWSEAPAAPSAGEVAAAAQDPEEDGEEEEEEEEEVGLAGRRAKRTWQPSRRLAEGFAR